jgi:hypothetical protein
VHFGGEDYPAVSNYHLWVQEKNYACNNNPCVSEKTYEWSTKQNHFVLWQEPRSTP